MTTSHINPFFAARFARRPLPQADALYKPIYVKLPRAPINASPVPGLTSLYHNDDAGNYGNRGYPGNCSGNLIRDLLLYFRPLTVWDPMTGSGTCRDVCRELRIACTSADIHQGVDACDPANFYGESTIYRRGSFDFVWLHPPYWRQKLYADDPRDMSRAPTLDEFLLRYAVLLRHSAHVLEHGGILAVLMGDYMDRESGFVPLTYHTKRLAYQCGLRQQGTDIIRFSHGASSSTKRYRSSFIPGLHDVCMIFHKTN